MCGCRQCLIYTVQYCCFQYNYVLQVRLIISNTEHPGIYVNTPTSMVFDHNKSPYDEELCFGPLWELPIGVLFMSLLNR